MIERFNALFVKYVHAHADMTTSFDEVGSLEHHVELVSKHLKRLLQNDISEETRSAALEVGKIHITHNVRLSWYVCTYNLLFQAYHEVASASDHAFPSVEWIRERWLWDIGITLDTYYDILNQNFNAEKKVLTQNLEELDIRAHTDPLTELFNRRAISLLINDTTSQGVFILLDLDGFKAVNDTMGHVMGDMALHEIGLALKANLRSGDIVGRIGGDEFCLWLALLRDSTTESLLATRVKRVLERLPLLHWDIGISGGVARKPEDGSSFEDLYSKADLALYRAKSIGKNTICFPDSSSSLHLEPSSDD